MCVNVYAIRADRLPVTGMHTPIYNDKVPKQNELIFSSSWFLLYYLG